MPIKSCNDFMKLPKVYLRDLISERLKFISPQQSKGYFGIFTTAHRAVVPHFRFKKDLILYLNSSRAARSGEFKFKLEKKVSQNLNLRVFIVLLRKKGRLISLMPPF
jgi:hypothetical protein